MLLPRIQGYLSGVDQTQTGFSTSEGFPDHGRGYELINRTLTGRLKGADSSFIWRSISSERAFARCSASFTALRLFQEVMIPI